MKWLGEVPEHWETLRLGNLLRERGEVNSNGKINQVLSVLRNRGVIPYSEKGNIGNKMSEDITRYKVVRPNDIVVNCMNVIIGSVGLSRYTGCLSPVYYVLTRRSEDDDPRYLNAYFQTKPFQDSLVRIGNGILAHRMRIPMELLKCEPFPRPPSEEQTAIARYLDHIGRRINRYVQAKQKLIALLEEQKQAIIQEAVTGRIDVRTGKPYAAYKDSGVEWLGEVPEHWEVRRLRNVTEVRFSNVDKHSKEGEKAVRLCNYSDVYHNDRIHSGMNFMRATASDNEVNRFRLVTGDVLITKDSETWDDIGVPACVESTGPDIVCGYHLALLRPLTEMVNGEFLHATLPCQSVATQLHVRANGVTRFGLSQGAIKSIWLQIPPFSEQTAIVLYLDEKTSKIDKAITRTQREIELLREYHQRLISDVVTGKLDVRKAAAKLPPEEDDCDPADSSDKIPDHQMPHDEIEPDTNGAMP